MSIIDRAKAFVHSLDELAKKTAWDWRRCPKCGRSDSCRWGTYTRHPWYLDGRKAVQVQRHYCNRCRSSYSEESPFLVRRSWYAREVHRFGIDLWQHGRGSLRRVAEFTRSLLGRQERWLFWRLLDQAPGDSVKCRFSPSTLHRWLDRAGGVAKGTVKGQLEGVKQSGQLGVDGLWARHRDGTKRVLLVLVDSVSGLIYPPVVALGEEGEEPWKRLFGRAKRAGLARLRGVTSDGAGGLVGLMGKSLYFVNHQRCVFHIWRNLTGELAKAAAEGVKELVGDAAKEARKGVRQELTGLVRGVLDAKGVVEAERALGKLRAHRLGGRLAALVAAHLDEALVHLSRYNLIVIHKVWEVVGLWAGDGIGR